MTDRSKSLPFVLSSGQMGQVECAAAVSSLISSTLDAEIITTFDLPKCYPLKRPTQYVSLPTHYHILTDP